MITPVPSETGLGYTLPLLPLPVASLKGWDGRELAPATYVHHLSPLDIASVGSAINHFEDLHLNLAQIYPETFPLPPDLAARLRALSADLHNGTGVGVVRGLIPDDYDERQSIIAFVGISSYIGRERATDPQGHTLIHVRDATSDPKPRLEPNEGMLLPGAKVPDALNFHADRHAGDILAMYLKDLGVQGGRQRLASFSRIYQELREGAPHIIRILMKGDWPWESSTPQGESSIRPGPVVWVTNGKPMIQFTYTPLIGSERAPRDESLPEVSVKQRLAMEMLESTASRFSHTLQREPGDILFVNNLSVLHARESYDDDKAMSAPASLKGRRHFLRLFIRDPERSWEKPQQLQTDLDQVFAPERVQHIPVHDTDPYLRFAYPAVHQPQDGGKPRPERPKPIPAGPRPEQHG